MKDFKPAITRVEIMAKRVGQQHLHRSQARRRRNVAANQGGANNVKPRFLSSPLRRLYRSLIVIPLLALIFGLAGCAQMGMNKQMVGAVTGAALGGALGSTIGHGVGKTVATIGGTMAGGLIGSSIGNSMWIRWIKWKWAKHWSVHQHSKRSLGVILIVDVPIL